jgi:toxin-antitoxin system PIN domain toxin
MIAIDTNLLVYAHRADNPWHLRAASVLAEVIGGSQAWALPWPCVHEFYASVTSVKWRRPMTPREAVTALRRVLASPGVQVIGEGANHMDWLQRLAERHDLRGGMIHDARIAAICLAQGVSELWTADRDFSRFSELKIRNPLL